MTGTERESAQATKDQEELQLVCGKCKVPLKMEKVTMNYLNHQLKHDFPKCPKCGQVYISEDIVNGKMKEVEMTLEDK
jgi:Zn finger protein HypA/HybF involved in hydrogenase expression